MFKSIRLWQQGVLVALMMVTCAWATEVPVYNGDFEILNDAEKPDGWVYTGMAENFGSAVFPTDSNNHVASLSSSMLIYQDIEASEFQLGHRMTLEFDVVKQAQSGPSTILVQLIYADDEGSLYYAGDSEDCEVEFEVYGGNSFTHHSVSIDIEEEEMVGYPLRVRFYATIQNEGKRIYLDNVTLTDVEPLLGDINYDGTVNWDDLDILLANWGHCNWMPTDLCTDVEPIPEDLLPERP